MRGCLTCRLRHLKCDKTGGKCLRCQRSGRECVPAPGKSEELSFRHGQNPSLRGKGPPRYGESDLSFPEDQIWIKSSPEYAFKDETAQTASEYHVLPVNGQLGSRSPSEPRSTPSSTTMDAVLPGRSNSIPHNITESRGGSRSASINSPQSSITPVSSPRLANVNEAYLLRHFQRYIAPWLDAGDPERHFCADAVGRASESPLLLYACLAVSACHLSRTTHSIAPDVADSYHERCVSIMLPVLDNSNYEISIDILLSSTVILRFFEQISCTIHSPPISPCFGLSNRLSILAQIRRNELADSKITTSAHTPSNDPQRHLLAGSVYISSHVDSAISGGLASASFWVFVLQDIQFALTQQKCLRVAFAPLDDRLHRWWATKAVLTDGDWVNQAIWLLAATVDFCYQLPDQHYGIHVNIAAGNALKQRIQDWEVRRPDAFTPLHISPPDPRAGKPFPVVWYTNVWHSTAVQHVCLAKALVLMRELEIYDYPFDQRAQVKEQITENLNYLFGIALSSDDEPSLRILAGHALCACSAWIDDPLAQTLLFDLLRRTERDNGWPWAYFEQRILQTWRGHHVQAR
ncbi:Fungal Zn(2)-Cys(6) binuclear cluster domain-containing protein [Penicillium ucsense]|uniref:Fungal Zn(2)-Cys(6) binuclear cluster domain-containing protein n=1 Tax=Penicillium ucsense TaxID=2839758 RepID=A0A8J8WGX2_9EURO|nr:Fungal Zn(2)-Cys(6) binuclear cluster domain-containing protein [Penicillium ucsense]KAF7736168.1 Fungal Zn(2)-Cys(6) binuclear cluster domain-containing protein [Penicillium ucsense]